MAHLGPRRVLFSCLDIIFILFSHIATYFGTWRCGGQLTVIPDQCDDCIVGSTNRLDLVLQFTNHVVGEAHTGVVRPPK